MPTCTDRQETRVSELMGNYYHSRSWLLTTIIRCLTSLKGLVTHTCLIYSPTFPHIITQFTYLSHTVTHFPPTPASHSHTVHIPASQSHTFHIPASHSHTYLPSHNRHTNPLTVNQKYLLYSHTSAHMKTSQSDTGWTHTQTKLINPLN